VPDMVFGDGQIMVRVGRYFKFPFLPGLQLHLLHQPLHTLIAAQDAFFEQLLVYPGAAANPPALEVDL